MSYKELINNSWSSVVLRGAFVALEGFILTGIFNNLFGLVNINVKETVLTMFRFWLVGSIANFAAIFVAFLIMHALINRWKASPSTKAIAATSIIVASIILLWLTQLYIVHLYRIQALHVNFH